MAKSNFDRRLRVKKGIRKKISGTSSKPRLSVYRSNKHIYAQLIDDLTGHTLASASSLDPSIKGENPVAVGKAVGMQLADSAKKNGIESALMDRNGFRFHGRVKAVADGAREGGLQI